VQKSSDWNSELRVTSDSCCADVQGRLLDASCPTRKYLAAPARRPAIYQTPHDVSNHRVDFFGEFFCRKPRIFLENNQMLTKNQEIEVNNRYHVFYSEYDRDRFLIYVLKKKYYVPEIWQSGREQK